jgi:hypothetical protein
MTSTSGRSSVGSHTVTGGGRPPPLSLALRVVHLHEVHENLNAAMGSRTTIDMAIDAVAAQNRCSRDAAFRTAAGHPGNSAFPWGA